MRTFGGYGKPYMVVVCIANRRESEELFEKISRIDQVKKMSSEQMQECMKNNQENIRKVRVGGNLERRMWNCGFVVVVVLFRND